MPWLVLRNIGRLTVNLLPQNALRTPWLDAYFVYSSTLGTHTFFLVFLPIFFFFGYDETGRGCAHPTFACDCLFMHLCQSSHGAGIRCLCFFIPEGSSL